MKKKLLLLAFALGAFFLASCENSADLITKDPPHNLGFTPNELRADIAIEGVRAGSFSAEGGSSDLVYSLTTGEDDDDNHRFTVKANLLTVKTELSEGEYYFRARAEDTAGQTVEKSFSLTVGPASDPGQETPVDPNATDPGQSETPADQEDPDAPGQPETPADQEDPDAPGQQETPADQDDPDAPGQQEDLADPDAPDIPDAPGVPTVPAPGQPGDSEDPDPSNPPTAPDQPTVPTPGQPGGSEDPDPSNPPTAPDQPTVPGQGGSSDQGGGSGQGGGADQGGGPPAPTKPVRAVILESSPGFQYMDLRWAVADRATSYEVYYNAINDFYSATKFGEEHTGTSLRVTGLANGTVYNFWVVAKNAGGSADESRKHTAIKTSHDIPAFLKAHLVPGGSVEHYVAANNAGDHYDIQDRGTEYPAHERYYFGYGYFGDNPGTIRYVRQFANYPEDPKIGYDRDGNLVQADWDINRGVIIYEYTDSQGRQKFQATYYVNEHVQPLAHFQGTCHSPEAVMGQANSGGSTQASNTLDAAINTFATIGTLGETGVGRLYNFRMMEIYYAYQSPEDFAIGKFLD
jgi:hypothetical protein